MADAEVVAVGILSVRVRRLCVIVCRLGVGVRWKLCCREGLCARSADLTERIVLTL